MFCKRCGNKLNEGDVFCPSCGSKIHTANSNKEINAIEIQSKDNPVQETKKKKTSVLTGLLIGIGGILIVYIIFVTTGIFSAKKIAENPPPSTERSDFKAVSEEKKQSLFETTRKMPSHVPNEAQNPSFPKETEDITLIKTIDREYDKDGVLLSLIEESSHGFDGTPQKTVQKYNKEQHKGYIWSKDSYIEYECNKNNKEVKRTTTYPEQSCEYGGPEEPPFELVDCKVTEIEETEFGENGKVSCGTYSGTKSYGEGYDFEYQYSYKNEFDGSDLIRSFYIAEDNKEYLKSEHFYNNEGTMIQDTYYQKEWDYNSDTSTGTIVGSHKWRERFYDDDGELLEEIRYYDDGDLNGRTVYTRDDSGMLLKEENYQYVQDGFSSEELYEKDTTLYDYESADGNNILHITKYYQGEYPDRPGVYLTHEYHMWQKYADKDYKYLLIDSGNNSNEITYYQYDTQGNTIKEYTYLIDDTEQRLEYLRAIFGDIVTYYRDYDSNSLIE